MNKSMHGISAPLTNMSDFSAETEVPNNSSGSLNP